MKNASRKINLSPYPQDRIKALHDACMREAMDQECRALDAHIGLINAVHTGPASTTDNFGLLVGISAALCGLSAWLCVLAAIMGKLP
jgi:hypothetical protein